ncbi:hypothetical protein BDZ45DRAFT_786965 [Acephala macrosclerotiorum]|nr:hypothetical protein BDZ45DRAFT_786965 [Acephala macrosclerotiorum]
MNPSSPYQRGNPATMSATQAYVSPCPLPQSANDAIGMDGTSTDFVEYHAVPALLYNAIGQGNLPPSLNDHGYRPSSIQYNDSNSMGFQSPYDSRQAPHDPAIRGQQDGYYGLVMNGKQLGQYVHDKQDSNYGLVMNGQQPGHHGSLVQDYPGVANGMVVSREDGPPVDCGTFSRQDVGYVSYPHHAQYPPAYQSGSSDIGLQLSAPGAVPGAYVAVPVATQASLEPIQFNPAKRKRPYNKTPVSSESFKTKHEFGLIQITITESDLRVIRKFYDHIPRTIYRKHDPNTEQTVRVTERELENFGIHLQRKGIQVRALKRKRDFMEAIPVASARYEKVMAKQVSRVTGRNMDDVLAEIRAHTI